MKTKTLCMACLLLMPFIVVSNYAEAATMNNYCGVPPYVIQNVPPNIMLLVDNSGSMYNFSYACTTTLTTAAGTNTNIVPVSSVAGFKVGQSILVGNTQLWISAINTGANTLTVGTNATFSLNATVQDYGCYTGHFYNDASSTCPGDTVPCSITATAAAASTSTAIQVSSTDYAKFSNNEQIVVVHGSSFTTLTISSKSTSSCGVGCTKYYLNVDTSVTVSSGDVIVDASCYSGSSANIPLGSISGFAIGEPVVILRGGTPYTTTITGLDATNKKLNVSPNVPFYSGDTVYDYTCYNFQTPFPEMSFDPTKAYYGYFNNSAFYTYTTSRFTQSRVKSGNTKASTEWDGNFLNWLTMRRADIIKAALTGGYDYSSDGTGFRKIRALKADGTSRGIYKAVPGAEQYMDCSGWGCTANTPANFTFTTGSTSPSTFTAYSGTAFTGRGTFNVDVQVPSPVAGVLQNTVGAKARIGLTYYAGDNGGKVAVPIAASALNSVVSSINIALAGVTGSVSATNTPLGEALYSVVGYFQQNNAYSGHYTAPSTSSTGPLYNSGDWTVSATVDPFNYGTSTTPRYPPCVQNYVLVITDGEPTQDGSLPTAITNISSSNTPFVCSDSSAVCSAYPAGTSCCPAVAGTSPDTYNFLSVPIYGGSTGSKAGLEKVAYYMHTTNLRPAVFPTKTQTLTGYFIFAFGQGSGLLKYAAINGAFDTSTAAGNNPSKQATWDVNTDGQPDNYYEASDGYVLQQALESSLSTMLKRASSGTAASVLASGESSGANIVQAVFYPRRAFGNTIINWTGDAQNLWYYKDPQLTNSTIREDTVVETPNRILDLKNDYIIQLYFDTVALQTKAHRWQDTNGDGSSLTPQSDLTLENLSSIWKAGYMLWKRNLDTTPRFIYTKCLSGGTCLADGLQGMMFFTESSPSGPDNSGTLAPYLQLTSGNPKVRDVIRFIHGYRDTSDGYTFDWATRNKFGTLQPIIDRDSDGSPDYRLRTVKIGTGGGSTNIWKLGDIVNSTPKISSWIPLNTYATRYLDKSYDNFTKTTNYTNRGLVFVGGNDGMLHAFKLGTLVLTQSGSQKATLVDDNVNGNIGDERWAFIPKQALPYLQYTLDPDYCHLYLADLTPMIVDASIGTPGSGDISTGAKVDSDTTPWRTILIGGMRWGGANRKTGTACNSKACNVTTTTSCNVDTDCPSGETCDANCINTPLLDPSNSSNGLGYSSYFALDVTDQTKPYLLWEYSAENLGSATTGPAVVRVGDKTKNGKWYAIFGSGPTGGMDVNNYQFLGRSDQSLNYFVVDLKTGALVTTISTGIPEAFSGSLVNSPVDSNFDYTDDAVYVGYVKKTGGVWTDGGIGAILIKVDSGTGAVTWGWRKIMDGIGPVTSAVANLQDTRNKNMWLYFGTGRYFYEQSTTVDDADSQRYLIGVKDPCFNLSTSSSGLNNSCTTTVSLASLTDVTSVSNAPTDATANGSGFAGWKVALDPSGSYTYSPDPAANFRAERVVTDTTAMTSGNVLFTTYKPYSDECGVGGKSFLWGVRYNTAGAPGAAMIGNALLQTSTGAITQIDFYKQFTLAGNRKSASVEGYSSEGAPSTIQLLPPAKKAIHVRER